VRVLVRVCRAEGWQVGTGEKGTGRRAACYKSAGVGCVSYNQ
jgi:hypothetical protein